MGKAHKAPSSSYKRRFWVTEHAVDRMRTRLPNKESGNNETLHRSGEDIGNLIDHLVCDSISRGEVKCIIDNGESATLVDIKCPTTSNDLWALVKRNTNTAVLGSTLRPEAVVTLLYDDMVQYSLSSGKWDLCTKVPTAVTRDVILEKPPEQTAHGITIIRHNKKGTDKATIYIEWSDLNAAEESLNKLRKDPQVDTNSIRVFREVHTVARIII